MHWGSLPADLRGRIRGAYLKGDREGLLKAHRAAIIWIRDGILPERTPGRQEGVRLAARRGGKPHYWEG